MVDQPGGGPWPPAWDNCGHPKNIRIGSRRRAASRITWAQALPRGKVHVAHDGGSVPGKLRIYSLNRRATLSSTTPSQNLFACFFNAQPLAWRPYIESASSVLACLFHGPCFPPATLGVFLLKIIPCPFSWPIAEHRFLSRCPPLGRKVPRISQANGRPECNLGPFSPHGAGTSASRAGRLGVLPAGSNLACG